MYRIALQGLDLSLQSCSLFCVKVAERDKAWAAPSVADLPGSHLIRAGYSLAASEPCLTLCFSPGEGEEGMHLSLGLQCSDHWVCCACT